MASAEGLGLDRPGVLHPAEMVDVVDVEVAEAAAAGPEEAVEVLDLPEQLAGVAGPFGGEGRTRPARACGSRACRMNRRARRPECACAVPAVPGCGGTSGRRRPSDSWRWLLRRVEHAARGRAVHGHRLLHEHVQALFDRVGEMHPAEGRRRGENGESPGFRQSMAFL